MGIFSLFKDPRLGILSAGNFVIGTSLYIVGGLLVELAAEFQVSIAKAGFLIAAFAITSVIAAPLFATLSAAVDRRKLLAAMLLVCAAANGAACLAQTYEQLLVTRIVAAVANAVFTPQASAVLGLLVLPTQRTQATSAIMLGWSLATVLGIPLGVWVGHQIGWRASFGLLALLSLGAALLLWRLLPPGLHVPAVNLRIWLTVLRTPALMLLIATSTIFAAGNHAFFSYFAPTISDLRPSEPGLLSALLLTYGLAAIASNLLAILLMDRLGLEKIIRLWGLIPIVVFALWPLLSPWLYALFALQLLWGLGSAGFNGLQQARLAAVAPALATASIALNSSAFYLGQSSGTLLGGAAWEVVGGRYLPWVGLGLLIVAMLLSRKGRHAARKLRMNEVARLPPE
ncbi:MFS transporter [Panacagrimonas sp.]|uniref:MFS transporter n=1 Tax=Panacagrimonas sp. TaxID=2480088 RepID=UPI003B52F6DC